MSEQFLLSSKYKAFLRYSAPVEFMEGTTASGKTTVGIFKFMLKVAESEKKIHILSGLDLGTIEKNIINKDLGICDIFGPLVEYNSNGKGQHSLPHILYHTKTGDKIIYVLGYDNKARWKKALGGQYGCLYIDEINIADMEYIREASMRCDYLLATLNPDDPNLPVYKEYINCSRPLPEHKSDAPPEINSMLSEEPKTGWVHWFFSFSHNAGLTEEKKAQIILNVPKGTKLYKNKIQGLRGRATGLIFSNFSRERHVITREQARKYRYLYFSAGLDTSYSQESPDTFAFVYGGITDTGKVVILSEEVYNNANLSIPFAPSDIAPRFFVFLERNRKDWGFARDTFIDSADQATITELNKYKREHGCAYNFLNAYKKITILDRIHLQLGWLNVVNNNTFYQVVDTCVNHIAELEIYSWKEDKYEPEDANDHTINASQYAWMPFKIKIGNYKE